MKNRLCSSWNPWNQCNVSRLILMLMTLLLLVMPATERYFTWDQSLISGRDLEFTLLGGLIFCGLVNLLARQASVTAFSIVILTFRTRLALFRGLFHFVLNAAATLRPVSSGEGYGVPLALSIRAVPLRI